MPVVTRMTSSGRRALVPLLLGGLLLAGGLTEAAESAVELDEVEVVGMSLRKLQREMLKTEKLFFARFNDLNDNDDFDIQCRLYKRTGTQVPRRECRVQFLINTQTADAHAFFWEITGASAANSVNIPIAAMTQQWVLRREEYLQTVRRVVANDPELTDLAVYWGRLLEQYDKATRKDD